MIRMFKSYCACPNPDIYIILHVFNMLMYIYIKEKKFERWSLKERGNIRRRTNNTMGNIKMIKGQTMIYKTYYRKLSIEKHKPH